MLLPHDPPSAAPLALIAAAIALPMLILVLLSVSYSFSKVIEVVLVLDNGPQTLPRLDSAYVQSRFGGPSYRGIKRLMECFDAQTVIDGRIEAVGRGDREATATYQSRMKALGLTRITGRRRHAQRDYDPSQGGDQVCILGLVVTLKPFTKSPDIGGRDIALDTLRRLVAEKRANSVLVYIAPNPGAALGRKEALSLLASDSPSPMPSRSGHTG